MNLIWILLFPFLSERADMNKKKVVQQKKAPINWDELRSRMESSRAALEHGFKPSPEKRKNILRERAARLAVEQEEKAGAGEIVEVVEFLLAHERYAVASEYVREIFPLNDLTPVPCTPRFVLGIVNVRGQVLSVIDIKRFFDMPEKGLTDLNKVIILHSDDMEFGILADAIVGVRNLNLSEIETSLPTLTGIRKEYLMGITRDREVVIDAGKLLTDKGIIVDENV